MNHYLRESSVRDAAAAEAGEAEKRERYPADPDAALPEVTPFVLESFGRLGPAAVDLLREARQRLAERDPHLRGWAGRAVHARWLGQLSVALQLAYYDAFLAMRGAAGVPRAGVRRDP